MLGERPEPHEVELCLNEISYRGAAYRGPHGQREREVFCQGHGAEERARLKENAERRHAFVPVGLSNAVDVDSTGHWLLEPDQVSQQCALPAPGSAENREGRSALDIEGDVLHEHSGPPPDAQVLDDDVRSRRRHDQTPITTYRSVNRALMTITPKIARTTAVVVRAPTAAAPPCVASP